MVVDYCLSCKQLTALQSCKKKLSLQNPDRLLMDSWWTPYGLHDKDVDSIRSPSGVYQESIRSIRSPPGVYQDSIRTPSGLHQEYQDFIRTPSGVHWDLWGSVTYRDIPVTKGT